MTFRPLSIVPFLVSIVCAIFFAQLAVRDPRYILPLSIVLSVPLFPALMARRRLRQVLMSGDPERVISVWRSSFSRSPVAHAETVAPLMAATAYASCGRINEARKSLDRAVKGPAWDAAIEQRLFVEAMLDAYEGERDTAVAKAAECEALPLPSGIFARRKVTTLRKGLLALTRAFAHSSVDGDDRALSAASSTSPLVHWAMRYARAIIAVDRGRTAEVKLLLAEAPEWPAGTAFQEFHTELLSRGTLS